MKDSPDVMPVRQRHLPHDGKELPGAPPPDARTPDEALKNAEDMIRHLIVEQKRELAPLRLPPLAPQEAMPVAPEPEPVQARHKAERKRVPFREPSEALERDIALLKELGEEKESCRDARKPRAGRVWRGVRLPGLPDLPSLRGRLMQVLPRLRLPMRLRAYRPSRRQIVLAALAGVAIWKPLFFPLLALLTVWVALIVYLTMGPERVSEVGAGLWARYKARRPDKAERLRRRADAFAERFDRLLDRLPEAWADRLALPDFSAPAHDAPDRPDPFDRLAAQTRDA